MAQRVDRRPGDKAGPELPQEKLARDKLAANLDQRTKDAQRAIEKAQGGGEVDAQAAAQLQSQLGNAALAGMVKEGSDTDSSTTEAEATLDQAREEQQDEDQEQDEDKETGEIEHVLPSFSTGGGGGGGNSPWAAGRMFGGDGTDDDGPGGPTRPKWRPMPLPPDPDEDVELLDVEAEPAAAEAHEASLAEAEARFGQLPWAPGVLSRGLRHPARLVGRAALAADGTPDAVWARARAALRFAGEHLPDAAGRALAGGGAALGVRDDVPLVLALAQELALLERALTGASGGWHAVIDAAADLRARPRVEGAAAELPAGHLSAVALLARALDTRAAPAAEPPGEAAHPAALAALAAAAHLAPLPAVDPWRRPRDEAAEVDPVLAAFDAFLTAETGGPAAALPPLGALYAQLEAALTALGAVQVELASAALAAWPWLGDGVAEAALADADDHLRQLARRVYAAGRTIEGAAASGDLAAIETASAEAAGLLARGAFVRQAALVAVAAPLLDPAGPVAPAPDDAWEARRSSGQTDTLRRELAEVEPVAGFARRVLLEGAAGAAAALAGAGGDAALLHAAALSAAGQDTAAAIRLAGWVGQAEPGPYAIAWAALLAAHARADRELVAAAAPAVWASGDGGALNLLKAGWGESYGAR